MGVYGGQVLAILGLAVAVAAQARPESPWSGPAIERAAAIVGAGPVERAGAVAFYGRRGGPVWHDAAGRPTAAGAAVRRVLEGLDAHGLAAGTYAAPASGDLVAADVVLTVATLRAMRHLHLGRIDPRSLGWGLPMWAEPHDFAAMLEAGVDAGTPAETIMGLAPPFALYRRLVEALATYRRIAAAGPLPPLPPGPATVRPGDPYPSAALRVRLTAFGDLEPSAAGDDTRYDGAIVDGVRRFQRRHGLTPDGVIGARTRAALAVSPAARAWQMTLALERLRWLPDLGTRRLVAVNIPMFRLWAWDVARDDDAPALTMNVIVGRAVRTQTPVFVDVMEQVIFRPYWNVPRSILRDEVLPAVRRRPGYLASQHMEIVRGEGDDGRVVALDDEALAGLSAGTLRVRQRPGPDNALGLVKFLFPNDASVYMHGTPAQGLFARDRRDFSHGCIRVADPPALARWVLGRQREAWPEDRIAAAMQGEDNTAVALYAPIDVAIFYLTAAVLPEDGAVHFAEDVYGHDARLSRALAALD
ncbi:MAG: murein L,D-transpeptidase [Vicinamibacterales bacterium]